MKANIEVDLREAFVGYGEDGEEFTADFGDVIQRAIVDHIVREKAPSINKTIDTKISEVFGDFVEKVLDDKIDKLLTNFLEGEEVTISNGYNKKTYPSLLSYVEEKLSQTYKDNLSGASCSKDLLQTKIAQHVEQTVRKELSASLRMVEAESKKIAKETIDKDASLNAIKNILKGN